MQLVADRFVIAGAGHAIDLATGDRVVLRIMSAGGVSEQTRWAVDCDRLHKLQHPSRPRLVDYGAVGDCRRFEAWNGDPAAFGAIDRSGIVWVERPPVAAIAELFDGIATEPRVVSIWGPRGSGKTTVASELARVARLRGYVPIAVRLIASPLAEAVAGRTLFLIDDEAAGGWRALVEGVLQTPRPHVLLFAAVDDTPGALGLSLGRLSPDALAAAVRPAPNTPEAERRVRRAAERADGSPGRFVDLLFGARRDRRDTAPATGAAEHASIYDSAPAPAVWPVAAELAALRQRIDLGVRSLDEGRHAMGDRLLRQTIAALQRRGDLLPAARGAVALASSLLKRGCPRDAQAMLDTARVDCAAAADDRMLAAIATVSGSAWIDLARLDQAGCVLAAALASARAIDAGREVAEATLALGRCLFWCTRYDEAERLLEPLAVSSDADVAVRALAHRARVAVGRRDLGAGVALAAAAVERAQSLEDAALIGRAAAAAAFAHLAVGDLSAVDRDAAVAIRAARAAHDPLRAIRVRVLVAERWRRAGRIGEATAILARLSRMASTKLSPVVRARVDLVASAASRSGADLDQRVRSVGLDALALWLPAAGGRSGPAGALEAVMDEVLEILHVCQSADDELVVLKSLCGATQRQLRAAAATVFATEGSAPTVVVSEGGRIDRAIAERAGASGTVIGPHRAADCVEAAAPVRYGGRVVGVLAVRWTIGATPDSNRATAILKMAATAAAPIVMAALARGTPAGAGIASEMVGASAAVLEIRRAIERAAGAPFAVLVQGESGTGKELVARAIHRHGPRRDRPFATLNCAALPDDLVESELFGHARGAFTGAVGERTGVFEEAHTGTLFLDEVAELSPRAQAKVLRVLQEGELRRIGENVSRRVDVRIVSATNRDLRHDAADGRFRLDLLYRLDVIRIVLPPLRDRREDVALLVDRFWRDATARVGSRATLSPAAVAALARHDWPGNVRELQNVLAALAVRCGKRGVVLPAALPPPFNAPAVVESWRLDGARRTFEERFVRAALVRTGGRRGEAAAELGVTRQGLTKLMARLGIE